MQLTNYSAHIDTCHLQACPVTTQMALQQAAALHSVSLFAQRPQFKGLQAAALSNCSTTNTAGCFYGTTRQQAHAAHLSTAATPQLMFCRVACTECLGGLVVLCRGTVTYLDIHDDPSMTIGIFQLPPGARMPLHDHPGMTVFSRWGWVYLPWSLQQLCPQRTPLCPEGAAIALSVDCLVGGLAAVVSEMYLEHLRLATESAHPSNLVPL